MKLAPAGRPSNAPADEVGGTVLASNEDTIVLERTRLDGKRVVSIHTRDIDLSYDEDLGLSEEEWARAQGSYQHAATWTTTDETGEPIGDDYEFSQESMDKMDRDLATFIKAYKPLVDEYIEAGQNFGQLGHDFWLTRNRHGAGFWDRGLGDLGGKLTEAADTFGEVDVLVGGGRTLHYVV